MENILLLLFGMCVGACALALLRRRAKRAPEPRVQTQVVFEKVREAGRLVALDVCAKEIATSTKGWSFLPPLILSPARLAMIFQFEKQYAVDLTRIEREDVESLGGGRFRVTLPPIEGALRLTDVAPYDIAAGRALGLIDIIQMDAPTQSELMARAQEQAAALYDRHAQRYEAQARRAVEARVAALLDLFGVRVEVRWREETRGARALRIVDATLDESALRVPAVA